MTNRQQVTGLLLLLADVIDSQIEWDFSSNHSIEWSEKNASSGVWTKENSVSNVTWTEK